MHRDADLARAREILKTEGRAIVDLADRLGEPFATAVEIVLDATGERKKGRVVVTGMGKAGIIGQKISATLASTGTPSWSIHPAEAPHGDLGRITPDDVVLALSKSGETAEISRLLAHVKRFGARVISITCRGESTLGRYSDACIDLGDIAEACPLGLAPSTSTTVMLALGDALALTVLQRRGFTRDQFAAFHPGGALGQALIRVEEIMRTGDRNVTVPPKTTVLEVIRAIGAVPNSKGRAGAACVVDAEGFLIGFFTLGDLRRRLEEHQGELLAMPVSRVMTEKPRTITVGSLAVDAAKILSERRFDELPVVEADGRLAGLIDVQDLLLMGFL
jgi:arabinose-5-phosphate isomerase